MRTGNGDWLSDGNYPTLTYFTESNIIRDVNDHFEEHFGLSSEIIGRPIGDITQCILEEDFASPTKNGKIRKYAYITLDEKPSELVQLTFTHSEDADKTSVIVQKLFNAGQQSSQKEHNHAASDLIFLLDNEANFKQINATACSRLGYEKAELLQMNIADITHSSIQNYVHQKWSDFIQKGEARGEHLLETKEGQIIYAECRGVANIRLGSHILILKTVSNITPRRNFKLEVNRTLQAIDGVIDGVVFTDNDFQLRYVNSRCLEMLGYDENEMLGQPFSDFCKSDAKIKEIRETLAEEHKWHGRVTALHNDRSEVELEIKITALPDNYSGSILWQATLRDMTDLLETEQHLSQSKKRFNRLLQAAPDGILIVDKNGIIEFSNAQIKTILGYNKEEIKGRPIEFLVPDHQRKTHRKKRGHFHQDPQKRVMGSEMELLAKHKDGSRVPVDIMLGPLEEEGRQSTIAIIRDISKFRETKIKLEQEKEFVKLLHRLTTIANQNKSLDQAFLKSIREICEYMGWPVGHVYLPANDGSHEFYPSDIWYIENDQKFEAFKKMTMCTRFKPGVGMVGDVMQSGKPQWYTNAHKNPGFVRRMPEVDLNIRACFGLPVLIKDKVVGVLEFFSGQIHPSDAMLLKKMVTIGHQLGRAVERKRSEALITKNMELFKQLFDHSPAGVIVLDTDETVLNVNNSFTKIFGYESEVLIGKELDDLLVPDELTDDAHDFNRKTFQGASLSKETTRIHKDGTKVPVVIHTVPVLIDEEIEAIFGIYVNLSKVKKTEDKLRDSLEEKKFLLKEIHHRVKNNLAIITSLLELQIHQADNSKAIRELKDSQSRIFSMAMVHEHLYQMESFSYLELDMYLKDLVEKIKSTFHEPDTDVSLEFDTDPVKVGLDQAISCGQLVNELVTNAFKHAFRGSRNGSIAIHLTQENKSITLKICDDGPGMPEDLFERKKKSLGLKLVDTLTKQLQGDLEIDSSNGTTFTLRFPKEEVHYQSQ